MKSASTTDVERLLVHDRHRHGAVGSGGGMYTVDSVEAADGGSVGFTPSGDAGIDHAQQHRQLRSSTESNPHLHYHVKKYPYSTNDLESLSTEHTTISGHHLLHHDTSLHHIKEVAANSPRTRWIILFVYCLLSASNGFQWINYAPIIDEVKEFYHVDSLQVNFLATIYTIVYPALIFIGCITFQRTGWYGGMLIGAALNALGASLKVVAALWAPHFAMLAFTQCINAFSEVFFLSLPPLIASVWFSSHQRTLATAIGVMSNSLGTAFGFLIPPAVVTKENHGASAFAALFGYQAIIAVLIVVACVCLPSKPAHHPSLTASKDTDLKDLIPSLKYLIRHAPFVILAFASGLSNDSLGTFSSFLAQLLQPYGIDEMQSGWIGFALTISGSVASTVVGVYIDRNRNYKPTLMAFSLGSVTCFSVLTLVLLYARSDGGNTLFGLCFFFITAMGGFLSAQIPLQLEYAVELTYPKPEGVTTAFLLCLSGILTPLLTLGGTEIVGDNPGRSDVIRFMVGCLALSATSSAMQLFIRNHRHRVDIEVVIPVQRHDSWVEEEHLLKRAEAKESFRRRHLLPAAAATTSGGADDGDRETSPQCSTHQRDTTSMIM